jgi:CSLREA domain-containing protein
MRKIYLVFSLLTISFIGAVAANAATFNVNTQNDTLDVDPGNGVCVDGSGNCSLRAAIGEANALAGPDTILLAAGTYTQTLVAPNEDANLGGDWDITSVITIKGTGEFSCALQAAASPGTATERVVQVTSAGELTISRVTVRNGFLTSMSGAPAGAGIQNNGILMLDNVIVRDNRIVTNQGFPVGAGIHNGGAALTLISTSVTANSNTRQAGGPALGGGIASTSVSTLTFTNSVVEGNSALAAGGFGWGAGIYLENVFTVNMTGGLVSNNTCGGTLGNNGSGVRAFSNIGAATFNATGTTFRDNKTMLGGTANQGIGLQLSTSQFAAATLDVTLDNVRIWNNQGNSEGIGINASVTGGNMNLNILNSAIYSNTGGTNGGGIMVSNVAPSHSGSTATVNITNSTISGNTASGNGGGIALDQVSAAAITLNLNHVTIAGNAAGAAGGGIHHHTTAGTINLKNSVVADNTGGKAPDISGGIVSGDYDHIEDITGAMITGATTHNAAGDALLGPRVQFVGGVVHMPDPASPVVNTIPFGTNDCGTIVTTDQRGALRPQAGACDKGSVERVVSASIGGRVTTSDGTGIRNATVTLSGGGLPQPLVTQTGSLGWYSFPDLPGEQSYMISASAKRFRFTLWSPIGFYLIKDMQDLDFQADPPGFEAK